MRVTSPVRSSRSTAAWVWVTEDPTTHEDGHGGTARRQTDSGLRDHHRRVDRIPHRAGSPGAGCAAGADRVRPVAVDPAHRRPVAGEGAAARTQLAKQKQPGTP